MPWMCQMMTENLDIRIWNMFIKNQRAVETNDALSGCFSAFSSAVRWFAVWFCHISWNTSPAQLSANNSSSSSQSPLPLAPPASQHFWTDINIWESVSWIVFVLGSDIHAPLRMNRSDFGDPLTFRQNVDSWPKTFTLMVTNDTAEDNMRHRLSQTVRSIFQHSVCLIWVSLFVLSSLRQGSPRKHGQGTKKEDFSAHRVWTCEDLHLICLRQTAEDSDHLLMKSGINFHTEWELWILSLIFE